MGGCWGAGGSECWMATEFQFGKLEMFRGGGMMVMVTQPCEC